MKAGPLRDEVDKDEDGVNQDAGNDTLRNRSHSSERNFFEAQRLGEAMITSHQGDDESKRESLDREQAEIKPAQGAGQLPKVISRTQRHVLEEGPKIAADQSAEDEIDRERKNPNRHPNHARHDQVVNRINSKRLERFDFTQGPSG